MNNMSGIYCWLCRLPMERMTHKPSEDGRHRYKCPKCERSKWWSRADDLDREENCEGFDEFPSSGKPGSQEYEQGI